MPLLAFPEEEGLGLEAQASLLLEAPVVVASQEAKGEARASNLDQPDLFAYKSLLVSTGFNLNGEFFPVEDTWAARFTPEDKPTNLLHNPNIIVGHTTDCEIRDAEGKTVPHDLETPPAQFDIWDTAVVYRFSHLAPQHQDRETFLAEILAGEWWVSMECRFDSFDYILVPAAPTFIEADISKAELVTRTKETSGMTKFLRAYKGTGVYKDGRMIGRVLRNFVFSGKGFVRKPGNPKSSVHLLDGTLLSGNPATAGFPEENPKPEVPVYADKEPELTGDDVNEIDTLKKSLAEAQAALASALEAKVALATAQAELVTVKAELTAKSAEVAVAIEAKTVVEAELTRVSAEALTLKAEKAEAEASAKASALTGRVKDAYQVDEAVAASIVATLVGLPDEALTKHLETVAAFKAPKIPPQVTKLPAAPGAMPKPVTVLNIAKAEAIPTPVVETAVAAASKPTIAQEVSQFITKKRGVATGSK